MTSLLLAVLLASVPAQRPPPGCRPDVERALAALDDGLAKLSSDVEKVDGRKVKARLRNDVDAILRARDALRLETCPLAQQPPPPPPPSQYPQPPVVVAPPAAPPPVIDERGFAALLAAVRRESFDDGRAAVIDTGVRGQCVTSDQAATLLRTLSFEGNKITSARVLVPRIVDRTNAIALFDVFTFDTDKRKLKAILDGASPEAACN
jgi:hypothetical protein